MPIWNASKTAYPPPSFVCICIYYSYSFDIYKDSSALENSYKTPLVKYIYTTLNDLHKHRNIDQKIEEKESNK